MIDPKKVVVGDVVRHIPTGRLYVITKLGVAVAHALAYNPKGHAAKRDERVSLGRSYPFEELEEAVCQD